MAVAPYQPFPTAEPTLRPAAPVEVNAPAAAFGTNVAQALGSVGADVTKAGDQLFSTALDIRKMRMEQDVMARTTEYEKASNEAHMNYLQLRGAAAADGYQPYVQKLEQLRQQYRGDLPLAGQVMYDNQTRNMMGRLFFSAGAHSGQQLTDSIIKTSKSSLDLAKQTSAQFWSDDAAFNAQLKTIEDRSLDLFKKVNGPLGSDDQIRSTDSYKDFILDQKSDAILERARIMAISDPLRAQKVFNDAQAAGQVRGDKVPQIDQWIKQRIYNVQAPQLARGVRDGSGYDWGSGSVSLPRAREAIGGFETGNNYSTVSTAETSHGHALGRYQVMSGYLPDFLKQAGMPSMTEKEFVASPAAQDQLFEKVFGGYMEKGGFNEAASRWFTGQSLAAARASGVSDSLGTNIDTYLRGTNAYLAKSASLDQQVQAGLNLAKDRDPNDPELGEHIRHNIIAEHGQDTAIARAAIYDAKEGVATALQTGSIKTVDDLMKDPKLAGTLANAPQSFMTQLPSMINRYNAAANKVRNDQNFDSTMGLLYSDNIDDRQKFQELDPTTLDISRQQMHAIWNKQAQLRKVGEADPKVGRAYQIIQREFPNSTPIQKDNPQRYIQFLGALSRDVEEFQKQTGKELGIEDIKRIGETLTRPIPQTMPTWLSAPSLEFERPIPQDFRDHFEGMGLDEDAIRSRWNQVQAYQTFNQFYAGSKSTKPTQDLNK